MGVDEHSATPEDLAPLELRQLRELDVARAAGEDRASYISAASAVVRRGDFTYVVGDDELDLGVFAVSASEPGEMRRALEGKTPGDADERKREKADLEALSALPPSTVPRTAACSGWGRAPNEAETAGSGGSSPPMAPSTATRARSTWRRSTRCCEARSRS